LGPFDVVLADDHAMFRQGVKRTLAELPGVRVADEARDGLALLDLLKNIKRLSVIITRVRK
jgi:DNA-binding NarL/FixJ family response regulator